MQILINLPDLGSREQMFQQLLPREMKDAFGYSVVGELDYTQLAAWTENYSGADINLLCKESAMRPLRAIFRKLETMDSREDAIEKGCLFFISKEEKEIF